MALHLLVICLYGAFGIALWWHAWDRGLSSTLTCACGDSGQAVWFVAWPAYALSHGLNPFFSGSLFAPSGVNLLSNASSTAVGIALTPITVTLGPVVATNVALTFAPALSSWACWVACRRFVSWAPAPVVAGLLFGYSPFVVTNLALGHLGLGMLVAPPLLLLACRRLMFGRPDDAVRAGIAIGLLLVLQFFISSEILALVAVVGLPIAVVAALAGRSRLAPARTVVRGAGAAAVVTAALLAAPVWFALAGPRHLSAPPWPAAPLEGNALSTFSDPGRYSAPGFTLMRLGGYEGLRGPYPAYLGPIVIAVGVASLAVAWRRRTTWVLVAGALLAALLSLGDWFWVTPGHLSGAWLPWRALGGLPLLDDVVPGRFSALVDLFTAILVGVGLDAAWSLARRRGRPEGRTPAGAGWRRVGGVREAALRSALLGVSAIAIGSLWWTYQLPLAAGTFSVPRWFVDAGSSLPPGSVVVSVPFPFPSDGTSAPMVWQADEGMAFRLAGGYAKAPGPGGAPLSQLHAALADRVLARLSGAAAGSLPAGTPREVQAVGAALRAWGVTEVVVTRRVRDPARAVAIFARALGTPPRLRFGAWVWALHPPRAGATRR